MPRNSCELIETLESRRLLSDASQLAVIDWAFAFSTEFSSPLNDMPGKTGSDIQSAGGPIRREASVIPNIRRTYTGSFNITTPTPISGTFRLVVRKEDNRGTYAALRGTLDITTNQYGALHGDMTYGKIRDNSRINMTFTGTTPVFTAIITGKSSTTGSQLKGNISVTGSVTFSTTFVLNKFVTT